MGRLIKGEETIIYQDGKFDTKTMKGFLITEKDVTERIRITNHTDSLDKIEEIYVERNGEVSFVKKEE